MISTKNLTKITIAYFIFMGLFCRYIEVYSLWKLISLVLIGLLFLSRKFRFEIKKLHINLSFLALLFVIAASCIVSFESTYIFGNILYIIWPLLYIAAICGLAGSNGTLVENFIDRLFVPLNFFFVFNIVLALIQTSGYPLLIRGTWLAYNSFYEDLCCGVFGLNGTHEFTSYALFMNIFVLTYVGKKKRKNHVLIYSYLVLIDLLLLFLSTRNDNVAMFVLLPIFIGVFLLSRIHFKTEKVKKTVKKLFKLSIPIICLLIVVMNIPYIKHYLDKYVWIRIVMLLNFNKDYFQIAGSNERLAIVFDALSSASGWMFGKGFGTADFGGGSYFGYGSFGLSSIGSFIMIGGVWFYLLFTYHMTKALQYLVSNKTKIDFFGMIIFGIVCIYTAYTILYTSYVSTFWFGMIFLELGFYKKRIAIRR